ncbi:RNA polymerase sigma-54 factor, partial [Candidatus Parcubacteria bacterium]
PQGTIPYKSFFSNRLETDDGEVSQKSILEHIRKLIQEEDPKHPLSDEKLAKLLKERCVLLN